MEQVLYPETKPAMSFNKAMGLIGASVLMILMSIYIFSAALGSPLVAKYSGFEPESLNTTFLSIFICISLPLAALGVSQILVKFRGFHGGVWAFFWGSFITLVAKTPLVFVLIGSAYGMHV